MAMNENSKFVILLDSSDEEEAEKNDRSYDVNGSFTIQSSNQMAQTQREHGQEEDRNEGKKWNSNARSDVNDYVYRTKAEEYRMLADLTDFPQLAAMFAFEATLKTKKRRKKQQLKSQPPNTTQTTKNLTVKEDPQLKKLVVSLDSSDDEPTKNDWSCYKGNAQSNDAQKREQSEGMNCISVVSDVGKYVCRTKAEEYRMLEDLSNFPQLAAMFAFEVSIAKKTKKRKKNTRKEKNNRDSNAHNAIHEGPQIEPINNDWRCRCDKSVAISTEGYNREHTKGANEGMDNSGVIPDKGEYIYRTKAEEYRMLADLSSFPQLAAMFAFEANIKKRNEKRNRNIRKTKKHKTESNAQNAIKLGNMEANEGPQLEKHVILLDSSDNEPTKSNQSCNNEATLSSETQNREHTEGLIEDMNNNSVTSDAGKNLCKTKAEEYNAEALETIPIILSENGMLKLDGVEVEKHVDSTKETETLKSLKMESVERKGNLVLQKLLRSPRYFDFPEISWQINYGLGKADRRAAGCTMEKRKKPCFVCGGLKHSAKHCKQGRECYKCNRRGHLAKECPEKDPSNNAFSKICLRCGNSGHDMISCNTDYLPDDLKEIQCFVCKEFGHLCCVDLKYEGPKLLSCYNCGEHGHLGYECTQMKKRTNGSRANRCYKCGGKGHLSRQCRKYAKAGQCVG